MPNPKLLPRPLFLGGALALFVVAVLTTALLWAGDSPASAQDDGETKVPAKPTKLSVATEQGSLDVSADWDDVAGAEDYLVRWRPKDGQLNDGVRVASSAPPSPWMTKAVGYCECRPATTPVAGTPGRSNSRWSRPPNLRRHPRRRQNAHIPRVPILSSR
ncbi:MAG: hypothetical protein OXF79_00950 [Chloroflexi bacterium]|nr:hypothetical protein [Chloroflexota bacterium]